MPRLPITHIVEEDGGLLVFSYSDVFRVDKALKSWKKVATLEIQYRWGRPDAVGSYPSVPRRPPAESRRRALCPRHGRRRVCAPGGNEGDPARAPRPARRVGRLRVRNTSEGTFFFEDDDRLPSWTLGAKGWEVASLAPPFEIDPANDAAELEKDAETWYETSVLVGPGGAIYTVSGTGVSDGTRTTAHRVGGKPRRLGRETSSLDPSSSFITADGTLWNASSGELKRFAKGRWETVARFPEAGSLSRLDPLNTNGPPWLLLDGYHDNLWRLDHGAQGDKPRLTRVEITEGGKTLRVDDAIPWPDDSLLLATDAGLRAYSPDVRKLSRVDFPEPPQPATTLVRDGLGRLWMGGGSTGLPAFHRGDSGWASPGPRPRRHSIACPGSVGMRSTPSPPTRNTPTVSSSPSVRVGSRSSGLGQPCLSLSDVLCPPATRRPDTILVRANTARSRAGWFPFHGSRDRGDSGPGVFSKG